jgi:glycosyltransferase involved in cell wall biosynthesis
MGKKLGVADRVVISGLQEDVRPFLSVCDVVALTSFTEAFSLAAIEAMALGRPVVHPEVGGAAEMIHSGHDGWLFPVGDTATLVERLGVLADPVVRARMGENARATVASRFSERAMVEHYETLLIEICASRRKSEQLRNRATAH